jgi:glycyl-tRNA synthetase
VPNVVEPSFGVGRILYCILEHVFSQRKVEADEAARDVRPSLLTRPPV